MGAAVQQNQADIDIQQGAFLVYIAGVHVPAASISVNFSFLSFSTATVTLPADDTLIKLGEEDRVPIVMFFLDKWYSDTEGPVAPTWRLLFDGDITQWSYNRGPYNRTISFNAISNISVMNTMSIIYLTGKGKNTLIHLSKVNTTAQGVLKNSANPVLELFRKGAYGTSDINRPMDFVRNLLTGMKIGGTPLTNSAKNIEDEDTKLRDTSSSEISSDNFKQFRDKYVKEVAASSEFFIRYNHRNKIDKRWVASIVEDISINGAVNQNAERTGKMESRFKEVAADGKLKNAQIEDASFEAKMKRLTFDVIKSSFTQQMSMSSTFWTLINTFYSVATYNIIQLPTAQFVHVNDEDIPQNVVTAQDRLANCLSVPNLAYAISPACNVLTPAMVEGFSFAEDYASQNTRVIMDGSFANPALPENLQQAALAKQAMRFGYPSDQNSLMASTDIVERYPENILIYPEEFFKGPVVSRPKTPPYFLTLEQEALRDRKSNENKIKEQGTRILRNQNTEEATAADKAAKVHPKEWHSELMYSFTKSFYLEERYNARNGSIQLAFNPYIVPGMTFTMLDNDEFDKFHMTGLITGVGINMSNSSCHTNMSYTAGRTLKEVYEQVFTENTFGPDTGITDRRTLTKVTDIYTTAPIMPIRSLADRLQVDASAAEFYASLLYSKNAAADAPSTITKSKPLIFRHDTYFKSTKAENIISKQKDLDSKAKDKIRGKTFPGTITKVKVDSTNKVFSSFKLDLEMKDEERLNIDNYTVSMERAARPICTLDEYVNMFNTKGEKALLATKANEVDLDFGVEYPVQIRTYVVDPDNLGDNFIRPYARPKEDFLKPSAELRRDWPSKLIEYRNRVKQNSILGN